MSLVKGLWRAIVRRTMYTIKQAALRAGVSVPVLRAWERRYGIVEPARTASRYRLYDEAAIQRVRTMRGLVDDGWSPSTAAAAILEAAAGGGPMPVASTASPSGMDRERVDGGSVLEPSAAPAAERHRDSLVAQFVEAAAALDQSGMEGVLDEMFAGGSFERVVERDVLPALRALGAAWEAGTVDVAGEHAASNAVLRRLAAAYEAAGRAPSARAVLVGLPPGGRHELGALAFAVAARRARVDAIYLGADLPLDDWVRAAINVGARAVVLGVMTAADVGPAVEVADAIWAAAPGVLVAFGGRAAPQPDGRGAGGWIRLPDGLSAAVEGLREALQQAVPTGPVGPPA